MQIEYNLLWANNLSVFQIVLVKWTRKQDLVKKNLLVFMPGKSCVLKRVIGFSSGRYLIYIKIILSAILKVLRVIFNQLLVDCFKTFTWEWEYFLCNIC